MTERRGDGGHFATLDAMRGIAALMVVAHHLERSASASGLFSRAYLAVDFFFMLSGFVLSRAYDDRFAAGLGLRAFLFMRLRRLWPTMATGIALGAAVAWGGAMPADLLAIRTAAALLFIPLAIGTVHLFVLDGVQWSLFFELLANLLHGAFLSRMSRGALAVVLMAAVPLLFGVGYFHGNLTVGHVTTGWIGGFVRVAVAYVAGMLLYRLWCRCGAIVSRPSAGWALARLTVALLAPAFCPAPWWWVDPAVVVAIFPAVLWLGAAAIVAPGWRGAAALGGAISYPLYAFHLPLLALGERLGDAVGGTGAAAFRVIAMLLAIGLSWLWCRADLRLPRSAIGRITSVPRPSA